MSDSPPVPAPVLKPKVAEHVLLSQEELDTCTAIVEMQYTDSEIVDGIVVPSNLNFCKTCNIAGLSTIAFAECGSHFQHQSLQIFKDMFGFEFIRVSDIEDILHTDEIAVYANKTEETVYYLRRRTFTPDLEGGYVMTCKGCKAIVPNAERDDLRRQNEVTVTVCSIECLVEYDRAHSSDEDSDTTSVE